MAPLVYLHSSLERITHASCSCPDVRLCASVCLSVSSLPEARCEPAACNAAEEEEVQEPNHPGLQDPRGGGHQHGRGTTGVSVCLSVCPPFWSRLKRFNNCWMDGMKCGSDLHVLLRSDQ